MTRRSAQRWAAGLCTLILVAVWGGTSAGQSLPTLPVQPVPTPPPLPVPPPPPSVPTVPLPPSPVPAPQLPTPSEPGLPPSPSGLPLPSAPSNEPVLGGGLLPPVSGLITPPIGGVTPGLDTPLDPIDPPASDEGPPPSADEKPRKRPAVSDTPNGLKTRKQSTFSLLASLTVGAESHTNVAFEPDGEGDVAGVLTPEVQLRYRSRQLLWKAAYRRTAEAYLRDSSLNTLNRRQGAETVLQARLTSRLATTATVAWRDTRDLASEIIAGTPAPSLTRAEYREWVASNGWTRRFTSQVDGDLAYQYLAVRFPTETSSSRQEHQGATGLRVRATPQDALLAQYDFRLFLFEAGPEYRVHALKGGYERRITQAMMLRLQAGPAWLEGPGAPDTGYLAAVAAEWRRETAAVRARYDREYGALSGIENVLETHVVSASASRRFSRATDVGASIQYRWQRDLSDASFRAIYQTWASQVVVSQQATDWLAWSAGGSMVWQSARTTPETTVVVRDYRMMVGVTLTSTTTFW